MKYLTIFTLSLFLFSCGNPTENVSNGIAENAVEAAKNEDKKIQQDGTNAVEKTIPPTNDSGEEMTEQSEGLMRGMFMYYADVALFTECETGKKYNVTGGDYLNLERTYLKARTKDFQKIYVELKGEVKMMPGMEGNKKTETLVVDEMVTMNTEKSCN